jgi:hypothetical protein
MPGRKTISTEDRGASVAVNHVLAIGITTILISGLLLSAATLLRDQRAQNAEPELRTIGNRIASHVAEGERIVDGPNDQVTFHLDQPARIAGSSYDVRIDQSGACPPPYNQSAPSGSAKPMCVFVDSSTVGEVPVPVTIDSSNLDIQLNAEGGGEYELKVCGGSC